MLIDTFKEWILTNRGYSMNTAKNYIRILTDLDNFIKTLTVGTRGIEECEEIKYSDVSLYLIDLSRRGLSVRTCNNYLFGIRLFLKMCLLFDYKVLDYRTLEPGKEYKKKIGFLTDEECRKMIDYAKHDNTKDELTKTRDLAMLYVFINTGVRVQELCDMKVDSILDEIQIEGKGGSLRPTYLFNEHLRLVNLYLFLREGKKIKSDYVFCSHANNCKGHQLSRASVENIIRSIGINAGIEQKVFPHLLRHTFASRLLKNGVNLYFVQQLLGHKNISSTQNYLGATNNELKDVLKRTVIV